jgi:hypothetical protein
MLRDYSIGKMLLNYNSTVVVSEGMMTKPHFPKRVSHEALSFQLRIICVFSLYLLVDSFYKILQIIWLKPCPLCDSGEHSRAQFLIVMKSEHEIRPALPRKRAVGTCLTFNGPTRAEKRSQDTSGTRARPLAHAAAKETVTRSDPASPCSRRSATTRRARA